VLAAGCGGGDSLADEAQQTMARAVRTSSTFDGYDVVGDIACTKAEPVGYDESTRYVCRFSLVGNGAEVPQTRTVLCNPQNRECAWDR
jgi:hypothetical protein